MNERFGTDGWLPVDLRIADDFPQSVAAYKQFDVLLVNAVYDGMNLVAKEGPLVNARDGVLVLSENAGAHEELGEWAIERQPVRRRSARPRRCTRRSRCPASERAAPGRGDCGRTCASTTSSALDRAQPARRPRRSVARNLRARDWRALARRRVRRGADGRCRRQAGRAPPRGRAGRRADVARDGGAAARAAEGRRAHDGAARRDHGREAHVRADPALPSAAALARRGDARGRRAPASRSRRRPRRPRRPASRWRR